MEMATFNLKDGYVEAILRGYKGSLLNSGDYALMCQCENLDDLKMHLSTTTYGNLVSEVDVGGANTTTQLIECCTEKFVEEFEYLQCQVCQCGLVTLCSEQSFFCFLLFQTHTHARPTFFNTRFFIRRLKARCIIFLRCAEYLT